MTRTALLLLVALGLYGVTWEHARQELVGIELRLVEAADSQSYYVYSYQVINPAQSTWAIGSFEVDISTSSGTPDNLPVTGALFEPAAPGLPPKEPHAEVGPITPSGWEAALPGTAILSWHPLGGDGLFTPDSVAPGDTLSGFGVRSSYLPGISAVVALPTIQSCCIEPDTVNDVFPGLFQFRVSAVTVAPRYTPDEITIDLVQEQLGTVCSNPLWIDDAALCSQLADSLNAAEARLSSGDITSARTAITAARDIVYANREPYGAVEGNAEWLLRLNLDQLLVNLPAGLPIWTIGTSYVVGDDVSHLGLDYRCRQSHTALTGWEPPATYALWERINTGGEWAPQVIYQTGDEAVYQGITYRAIQGHQSLAGWEPPEQPALWEVVN